MGFGTKIQKVINALRESEYLPLRGSIIELGAQQLNNDLLNAPELVRATQQIFQIENSLQLPKPIATHKSHGDMDHLPENAPTARSLWEWMGYKYECIDIDGSSTSIPVDLNYDQVPASHRKQYDLVTNFGTTEHVANQLNAFKIIHDLTKAGAMMIHDLPAQGYFNHGLFSYNPKFFWLLARSNLYKWHLINMDVNSQAYPMPDNIIENIGEYSASVPESLLSYQAQDCGLLVVLQKQFDIDFVAPLDVNTGTQTTIEKLRRRYWTVFTPISGNTLQQAIGVHE